jgi:hypothetical protein
MIDYCREHHAYHNGLKCPACNGHQVQKYTAFYALDGEHEFTDEIDVLAKDRKEARKVAEAAVERDYEGPGTIIEVNPMLNGVWV